MFYCVYFGSLPLASFRSSILDAVADRRKLRRFYPSGLTIRVVSDASNNSH